MLGGNGTAAASDDVTAGEGVISRSRLPAIGACVGAVGADELTILPAAEGAGVELSSGDSGVVVGTCV